MTETNFDRLWLLVTITNLTTLLPLVFLKWLPAGDPQADLEEHTTPSVELYEHHAAISGTESALFPTVEPNLVGSQSEKQS